MAQITNLIRYQEVIFTVKLTKKITLDQLLISSDGGVNILAKLNGQEICKSEAVYGIDNAIKKDDGESWVTIRNMTTCNDHPVKFNKGDTVVIEANYDFNLHPRYVLLCVLRTFINSVYSRQQHHGGMGELMGTFSYAWAA
jgi:hypothetical protein